MTPKVNGIRKVGMWVGLLTIATVLGTAGVGTLDWFRDASVAHAQTDKHQDQLERITDAIENINGRFCREEIRRCVERAKRDQTDPADCLDLKCAADEQ